MTRRRRQPRAGYTILELVVVMVIVLLLAAIVGPSLVGFWSNNRTKAAVDTVTARLADARGAAISQGRPYRVSVSPDGRTVRVSPDESEQTEELITEEPLNPVWQQDTLPTGVVLTPIFSGTTPSPADVDGWITLVTFQADGTCREDSAEFDLSEPNVTPMVVRVRGLTGVWTVNTAGGTGTTTMGGQP